MNKRLVIKILGLILLIEAAFMLIPMMIGLICGENDWKYFLFTLGCSALVGAAMMQVKLKTKIMYARDGLVIVGASWVLLSLVGAVPYFISGLIPDYINAFFESVSGFTTSGISVIADVEAASNAMLMWRSLTHWIGGMGVLVFMLAISPVVGGASMHLMRAEAPGPVTEKIRPRISQTAKWLYAMYFVLTGCEILALSIAGMSVFHSTLIAFGTLATGGFAFLNSSLATFTVAQQVIVEVFMVMAGVNFSLYFLVITGKIKKVFRDVELRWYLAVIAMVAILVSINVHLVSGCYATLGEAIHQSCFAVISAITSTGFNTFDYNLWPGFSKTLIVLIMFVGGCAGSTAGGIKVSRFVLMFKSLRRNVRSVIYPKRIGFTKYNGKTVPDQVIRSTMVYFMLVILITVFSMIIVSLEPEMDISTAFASVATTLNNNGIEIKNSAVAGFANYHWWSRLVYIIDMLIGRLEVFPIMVLFMYLFRPADRGIRLVRRKVRIRKDQ